MRHLPVLLPCVLLASCAAPLKTTGIHGNDGGVSDYSVVHLVGKIDRVPANSKWPASIKVGTSFDYWAVIDNAVKDSASRREIGSYEQTATPARYDILIGDGFRFSSDRLSPRRFSVGIRDGLPKNDDGYFIAPNYHTILPEAPGLHAVAFHISLATKNPELIATDKLPVRPLKPRDLNGGIVPQFRGVAFLKGTDIEHSISGSVTKFEVFQARADTPLP